MDNRKPYITYVKLQKTTDFRLTPLYEFQPNRGWKWLQRIAFAVLDWIGAHHYEGIVTYTRTKEENDNILKSLIKQEGQWLELIHNNPNQMQIYMGPDDFEDLMKLSDFRDMQPTLIMGRIDTNDQYGNHQWHNIPITIVPWMVGAILVPK